MRVNKRKTWKELNIKVKNKIRKQKNQRNGKKRGGRKREKKNIKMKTDDDKREK